MAQMQGEPEIAVAQAGGDAEVAADLRNRSADRAAADLRFELVQRWQRVGVGGFGQVGAADRGAAGRGRFGEGALGLRPGLVRRGVPGLEPHQVAAARGAGEQHAFQRHGPQQAAGEAGLDRLEAGGAEELRDGREAAGDGAVFQGFCEVEAVADQDVHDGEHVVDARRDGLAGPDLWGFGEGR